MPDSLDPDSQQLLSANMESVLYLQSVGANVSATAFLNVPLTLDYVVYAYVVCTNSGGGDTVPTLSIGYTDDSGANTQNLNMPASPSSGQKGATVTCFYATAGNPITYTLSGGAYGNGSLYSIRLICRIV